MTDSDPCGLFNMEQQNDREMRLALLDAATFSMTVKGFQTRELPHFVAGIRDDDGSLVRVFLDERTIRFKGKSIKELQDGDSRGPPLVEGSSLIVESAWPQEHLNSDGSRDYTARWCTVASHVPGTTALLNVVANVHQKFAQGTNRPYHRATFLFERKEQIGALPPRIMRGLNLDGGSRGNIVPAEPKIVEGLEDLKRTIFNNLRGGWGTGIRILDMARNLIITYTHHKADIGSITESLSLKPRDEQTAWDQMLKQLDSNLSRFPYDSTTGESVLQALANPFKAKNLQIETIPSRSIFIGAQTNRSMLANKELVQAINLRRYEDPSRTLIPPKKSPYLFIPSIMAVRAHDRDDQTREQGVVNLYFTNIVPLLNVHNRVPICGIQDAVLFSRTSRFKPPEAAYGIDLRAKLCWTHIPGWMPPAPVGTLSNLLDLAAGSAITNEVTNSGNVLIASDPVHPTAVAAPTSIQKPSPLEKFEQATAVASVDIVADVPKKSKKTKLNSAIEALVEIEERLESFVSAEKTSTAKVVNDRLEELAMILSNNFSAIKNVDHAPVSFQASEVQFEQVGHKHQYKRPELFHSLFKPQLDDLQNTDSYLNETEPDSRGNNFFQDFFNGKNHQKTQRSEITQEDLQALTSRKPSSHRP